jgi:hypothetical protein
MEKGMPIDSNLVAIIERSSPFWAAEAEIVRTYWRSPVRSTETDRLWLVRQMYKELWDGFYPSFSWITENFEGLESSCPAGEMFEEIEVMQQEFAHYVSFASVYAALSPSQDQAMPSPAQLREAGDWSENQELMRLRTRHVRDCGPLGKRAHRFTEGGYCTLYSEGMSLKGTGGVDDLIAEACSMVFDDEFEHMLRGIADVAREGDALADADWNLLSDLTIEQLRARLRMRNSQFSFPVPEEHMQALLAGECAPVVFDYDRAFGIPGKPPATTERG